MRKKDFFFIALLAGVILAVLMPALLQPAKTLGNFGDIYAYHHPLQHAAASEIQSGRLPFWNPYVFAGLPLLANSQSAVFYPPAVLLRMFPLAYAFTLYALLHLLLAALGMYLLLRSCRVDAAMSALFTAAFSLGPFLIYRIPQGIPTHLSALAFVPWCWLALRSGRTGYLGGVWALQFFSGHPQFALINAAGMGVYAAFALARRNAAPFAALVREGGIAAALCLVQLFPMAEFIAQSNRAGIPAAFKTAYSMPFSALATLLRPSLFGDPLGGGFASVPSVFFEMYVVYVGWIPFVLAVFGLYAACRRDQTAGPLDPRLGWALAAIGVFFAMGSHNPLAGLMQHLPVAGLSRVPARFTLLVFWGLLTAGAGGWLALRRRHRVPPMWKAAALLLVLADAGFWAARFVYAENPEPYLRPNPVMRRELAGRQVRFASSPELANPNKAVLYRAMNVNGYDAFYLDSYTRYAARSERGPAGDPSRTYIRRADSAEMKRLGVAYYLEVNGGMKLRRQPNAYPLAYIEPAGGAARATQRAPGRWLVRGAGAVAGARLILSIPRYPGWRAYVNGGRVPVSLHDGLVQSIAVPAEQPFRADFLFIPTAWMLLCAVSAAAWIAWSAFFPRSVFA
ncbi:MAG: hypothetical protein ABIJ96_05360 [Elusimicrobiota bacterium]